MLQPIFLLVSAAIVLLIGGCQAVDLKGPGQITGLRPQPGACDMLKSDSFTAVTVPADTPECPKHLIGLSLSPGMVLHLATPTWGPPIAQDLLHLDANIDVPPSLATRQPQLAAPLRLPVRKLGPHSQLTDEEILVLGAFLSVQRAENFGTDDPEGQSGENLSANWQKMLSSPTARKALWNAFVDAASIRRIAPESGISEVNRALALVVNPKVFCDHAVTPPGPYPKLALTTNESELLRAGLFGSNCTKFNKDTEAFGLSTDAVRADPLAAIVIRRRSALVNPGFFASGALTNPATVVSAELGAVSMRRRDSAERRWSLAEWEESGVCGGGRSVLALGITGAILDYEIVGRGGTSFASFRVSEELQVSEDPTATRIVRRANPIPGVWRLMPAIAADDLARITPDDISYVVWSGAWTAHSPDPCQP